MKQGKRYGLGALLFDLFMVWLTKGLWLFVILIQYLRTH